MQIEDSCTEAIASYVFKHNIRISDLAKGSGVPYHNIYNSIGHKILRRPFRADEFMLICEWLQVNPREFAKSIHENLEERG